MRQLTTNSYLIHACQLLRNVVTKLAPIMIVLNGLIASANSGAKNDGAKNDCVANELIIAANPK